ncbi:invasion associated locus B family protein [Fusobacterium sp. SYSU M8D902]|uniref:invasion associated locus B family protein n=1 Tax=Fusobacterium sp. SYSU M8D902 TaxID=3159562 RepID=UPI0032E511FE
MIKKIVVLFFMIFSMSFSAWETINLVDEFGDETGQIAMFNSVDFFQGIRLVKDEDGIICLDVLMGPECVVGEIYPLKMKIDDGKAVELTTMAVSDRLLRVITLDEQFFEKLKKGNRVSFVVYNTNGGAVNLKMSLSGFTNAYNRVMNSN